MASSINPSNVDGTYPVAGQDNDSQGFRDNFTNIKTILFIGKVFFFFNDFSGNISQKD